MKGKNKTKWYDNGNIITTMIIVTIIVAIVCSQSFAVVGKSSLEIFSSIINHNSIYLLIRSLSDEKNRKNITYRYKCRQK